MIKRHRSLGEIEEIARRLRKELNVDDLRRPDLISLFENGLKEIYPELRLIRVLDEELPDSEARADCYKKTITVRVSVYLDCLKGDARARLTLAHELGHIALGQSGTRHRQSVKMKSTPLTHNRDSEKSEAWHFARLFLAPTFLAVECQSAQEISEKFGLSNDAAEIRFAQLAGIAKVGVPPSQRWELSANRTMEDPRDSRGRRILPTKVIDLLSEARRLWTPSHRARRPG